MDELDNRASVQMDNDYEKNSISEGFNSISKMQNPELILKQINQSSMYKVNLAAALHDHISCTKLQPDLSRNEDGLFTLSLNPSRVQHHQKEMMENDCEFSTFNIGEQDDTFKDIILVQLDLIQHQQEQLLKKERQLQTARQDCETMYRRLDGMEKEILHLKEQLSRKEEINSKQRRNDATYLEINKDSNDGLDNQLTFCNFLTDPSNLLTTSSDQYPHIISINQSPKSQLTTKQQNDIKQMDVNNETSSLKKIDDRKRKKLTNKSLDGLELKDDKKGTPSMKKKSVNLNKKMNDKSAIVNSKKAGEKNCPLNSSSKTDSTTDEQAIQMPIKTIETDYPYEIVTNKDFFNSLDEDDHDLDDTAIQTKSNQQSNIEIPSWRLYPISCSYSLEGTECLHDDVFYRRHSKLENDEKRRKRWEMQRMRELKNNERLRSGRYGKHQLVSNVNASSSQIVNNDNNSNDVSSFYPRPNILKYIEVSDVLPVVAFGHPIPELPPKKFQLPWNNNSSNKVNVKNVKVTKKS